VSALLTPKIFKLGLMNREKWDEWFRDLAFKIVDVEVSVESEPMAGR